MKENVPSYAHWKVQEISESLPKTGMPHFSGKNLMNHVP